MSGKTEEKVRYPTRENGNLIVPARSRELQDLVFTPNPESPRRGILSAKISVHGTSKEKTPTVSTKKAKE
jgi:hypothetical protein